MLSTSRLHSFLAQSVQALKISSALPTLDKVIVGTHDGNFHCDEALAIALLLLHPGYSVEKIDLVRTRNVDTLNACNLIVDVGAKYEPSNHRYDHHQREFTDTFSAAYKTKLSSAGLVYKHFGKEILRNCLTQASQSGAVEDSTIDVFYEKLYKDFMEHIDAIDNGVAITDGGDEAIKYHISTTLSNRVNYFNPGWNEEISPEILNDRFKLAVELTGKEFLDAVLGMFCRWWPAREIVQNGLGKRFEIVGNEAGKVMVLEQACPWKDHLFDIEDKAKGDEIIYVVYPDSGGTYRIQAVPVTPNSFNSRKKLPEAWCGLRDNVLSEKIGMQGAIFVHATGFIGGHQTREGAIYMALQALNF